MDINKIKTVRQVIVNGGSQGSLEMLRGATGVVVI